MRDLVSKAKWEVRTNSCGCPLTSTRESSTWVHAIHNDRQTFYGQPRVLCISLLLAHHHLMFSSCETSSICPPQARLLMSALLACQTRKVVGRFFPLCIAEWFVRLFCLSVCALSKCRCPQRPEEAIGSSAARVTCGFQPRDLGSRTQTRVLWKSGLCS